MLATIRLVCTEQWARRSRPEDPDIAQMRSFPRWTDSQSVRHPPLHHSYSGFSTTGPCRSGIPGDWSHCTTTRPLPTRSASPSLPLAPSLPSTSLDPFLRGLPQSHPGKLDSLYLPRVASFVAPHWGRANCTAWGHIGTCRCCHRHHVPYTRHLPHSCTQRPLSQYHVYDSLEAAASVPPIPFRTSPSTHPPCLYPNLQRSPR
mmetsp:Transcript_10935/g.25635  ORF Transcript_10935/g.25635 Transcript_10935/m.25635 type:complete len:203 (-) Transcript_10935:227-835(-)